MFFFCKQAENCLLRICWIFYSYNNTLRKIYNLFIWLKKLINNIGDENQSNKIKLIQWFLPSYQYPVFVWWIIDNWKRAMLSQKFHSSKKKRKTSVFFLCVDNFYQQKNEIQFDHQKWMNEWIDSIVINRICCQCLLNFSFIHILNICHANSNLIIRFLFMG